MIQCEPGKQPKNDTASLNVKPAGPNLSNGDRGRSSAPPIVEARLSTTAEKRNNRLLEFSGRLPVFSFGEEGTCSYCGDPATGRDHVIAVSFQHCHRRSVWTVNGPWTWCCALCNSFLGNRYFDESTLDADTFKCLDRKALPILWHFYELRTMDYTLKTLIAKTVAVRRWMRMRADWYGSRDHWLNLENLQWSMGKLRQKEMVFLEPYFRETMFQIKNLLYRRT